MPSVTAFECYSLTKRAVDSLCSKYVRLHAISVCTIPSALVSDHLFHQLGTEELNRLIRWAAFAAEVFSSIADSAQHAISLSLNRVQGHTIPLSYLVYIPTTKSVYQPPAISYRG
jgi:hypothetical protein